MAPATQPRLRHSRLPRPGFRPRLERLEDRWVPSAVRQVPGFDASSLPPYDDVTSGKVLLGFRLKFLGKDFDKLFVNSNGNVTFDSASYRSDSAPLSILDQPIIAPFFADVDVSAVGGGEVRYGQGVVDGRAAFGVTWDNVGYFYKGVEKTNRFQLVLTDRSDLAPDAFGIEFNYDRIQWDRRPRDLHTTSARVGYSGGRTLPGETVELPGSGIDGAFLDGGPNSLAALGRVSFLVRQPNAPVIEPISSQVLPFGQALSVRASASDLDHDQTLTYSLLSGPAGAKVDAATGLVTWTPGLSQPAGNYVFSVGVTDSGSPRLTDVEEFTVTRVVNPPIFEPVSTRLLPEGQSLSVQLYARDADPGQKLTYSLLSGPSGATVNGATGLVSWTPDPSQPMGSYDFRVGVADSGSPSLTDEEQFTVFRQNVAPVVTLSNPAAPHHTFGTEFALAGRFIDPGHGGWDAVVDFGDGTAPEQLALNPDGSYVLRHTFKEEGNHTIVVTVTDAHGAAGQARFDVIVLPGGVELFETVVAQPGETVTTDLVSPGQGASINVEFTHAAGASGPATLFLAVYTDAPLETNRDGVFFDVNLTNAAVGDEVSLTFKSDLVKGGFEFGFFEHGTKRWVNLLTSPDLAVVTVNPETGEMTVRFKVTHIFGGTVFTVSLASSATTTTGTIQPPMAMAPSTPATSDGGGGLTRAVTFSNNAQLSLALNASRETRLSVSGTSQGSQAANAAANGVNAAGPAKLASLTASSGVGGDEQLKADNLGVARRGGEESILHLLLSDQGILELLLEGIDPALLVPMKVEEEVFHWSVPEVTQPAAVAGETVAVEAVAVAAAPAEEEQGGEFTAALLALVPGLLGVDRRRKPRRGELG